MTASMGDPIFLQRIDGCPNQEDKLSFPLTSWLTLLADTINASLDEIEMDINGLIQFGLTVPSFTTAQITTLATGAPNGTMWMCSDASPQVIVVKLSGALRQITTTAFP